MKNSCNSSFSWCSGTVSNISQLASDLTWDVGQPDNLGGNESCVHLKIPRNGTEGVKLTDKSCNNKYIAACEVFLLCLILNSHLNNFVKGRVTTKPPGCLKGECPTTQCNKNVRLKFNLLLLHQIKSLLKIAQVL